LTRTDNRAIAAGVRRRQLRHEKTKAKKSPKRRATRGHEENASREEGIQTRNETEKAERFKASVTKKKTS